MLYVTTDSGETYYWKLGEPHPRKSVPTVDQSVRVHVMYADGLELDYVRQKFENLPLGNHVFLVGGSAQLVYDNL